MYSKNIVLSRVKLLQAIPSKMNQSFESVLFHELIKLVYKWFISESHIFWIIIIILIQLSQLIGNLKEI